MKVSLAALVLAILLMLGGCGKGSSESPSLDAAATTGGSGARNAPLAPVVNKLAGTWNQTDDPHVTATATFTEDGTFTVSGKVAEAPAKEITLKGTYLLEGNDLTRTFTEVEITGAPPDIAESERKALEPRLNKPHKGKIEWISDNEIRFTEEGETPSLWKKA